MPRNAWDSRKRAGSQIQSILISKRNHTLSQARKWLKNNDFAVVAVDETDKNYRFRQKHPDFFISSSFRTITLDNGVKAVVGIPKAQRGSKSNPRPFQRHNPDRTWNLTEDCRIEVDPLADVPEFDLEETKPVETVRPESEAERKELSNEDISELSLKDWTENFQSAHKQYNKALVEFFKAKKENYGEAAFDKAEDDYDAAKSEISRLLAQGNKTYVAPIMYRFWTLTSRFNIGDTAYLMSSKSPEKVEITGFTVPFPPYENEFIPKIFSYDYKSDKTVSISGGYTSNVKETTASNFVSSIQHPIFHHLAKHLYPAWIAKCYSYVVAFHIFYDVRDAMRGNTVWADNEQAVAETKVIIMTKFVKYSAMYFSEFQKYFPLDVDMEDGLTTDIKKLNTEFSKIVDYNRERWDTPFAYAEIKGQDYLLSESVYIKSQQPKQKSPQELAKNFKYATFPFSSVVQAYSGTSQVPEKRAFSFLDDYEHHINAIQEYAVKLAKNIGLSNPESAVAGDVQNYISKYYSLNEDMLNSRKGLVSSFVAGPANFPKARMDKKSAAVDNKISDMLEYTEKWKKRLQKNLKELYIQEQGGAASVADSEIEKLKATQTFMKEANKIVRKKKLSDAEKVRLMLELAKKLGVNTTEKSVKQILEPDFAGRVGFQSYQLTSINNRIKEREKKIDKIERRETAAKEQGTLEIPFESDLGDGKVEYDAGADRLRVYFDDRLSKDDFKKMRSAGFRWAKSLEAFSRNLNNESVWKAKRTLGLDDLPSVDDYLKGNVQIEPESGSTPLSEPIKEFELEPEKPKVAEPQLKDYQIPKYETATLADGTEYIEFPKGSMVVKNYLLYRSSEKTKTAWGAFEHQDTGYRIEDQVYYPDIFRRYDIGFESCGSIFDKRKLSKKQRELIALDQKTLIIKVSENVAYAIRGAGGPDESEPDRFPKKNAHIYTNYNGHSPYSDDDDTRDLYRRLGLSNLDINRNHPSLLDDFPTYFLEKYDRNAHNEQTEFVPIYPPNHKKGIHKTFTDEMEYPIGSNDIFELIKKIPYTENSTAYIVPHDIETEYGNTICKYTLEEPEKAPKAKSEPVQEIKEERIKVIPEKPKKAVSGRTLDDILGTANKEFINPAVLNVMADIVNEANWDSFETSDVRCWNMYLNKINERANPEKLNSDDESEYVWFSKLIEITKSQIVNKDKRVVYDDTAMLGGTYFITYNNYDDNEIKVLFLNYIVETDTDVTYKLQIVGLNNSFSGSKYAKIAFIYDCVVRNLPNYDGELLPAENSHKKAFNDFIDPLLEAMTLGTYFKRIGLNLNALEATYLASKLLTKFSADKIGIKKPKNEPIYSNSTSVQYGKVSSRLNDFIMWNVKDTIYREYTDTEGKKRKAVVIKKGNYIGLSFTVDGLLRGAELGNLLDLKTLPNWISLWLIWFANFQDTTVSIQDVGPRVSNPKLQEFITYNRGVDSLFEKHFSVDLKTDKSKYKKPNFELTFVKRYFSQMSMPMELMSYRIGMRKFLSTKDSIMPEDISENPKAIRILREIAPKAAKYYWVPMYETITENDPYNDNKETVFISVTNSVDLNSARLWTELVEQRKIDYVLTQQPSGMSVGSRGDMSKMKKAIEFVAKAFNEKLKEDPSFQEAINGMLQFGRTETVLGKGKDTGPILNEARNV